MRKGCSHGEPQTWTPASSADHQSSNSTSTGSATEAQGPPSAPAPGFAASVKAVTDWVRRKTDDTLQEKGVSSLRVGAADQTAEPAGTYGAANADMSIEDFCLQRAWCGDKIC